MRRTILMVVLGLGVIGGYASGFAQMHHCSRARRAAFEQHVAKVCVAAAKGNAAPPPDDY